MLSVIHEPPRMNLRFGYHPRFAVPLIRKRGTMTRWLAAECPKCSKLVRIRSWTDPDAPTFDVGLLMKMVCPHCGQESEISASAIRVIDESKLT